MNNIDEFRRADFGKYLLESKVVAAGKEKFMVHWTRKFFEYRLCHPQIIWFDFLSPKNSIVPALMKTGKFVRWMIYEAVHVEEKSSCWMGQNVQHKVDRVVKILHLLIISCLSHGFMENQRIISQLTIQFFSSDFNLIISNL